MIKTLALMAISMSAGLKNHANLDRPASESDLLRAFGFSACLAKAYEKTPFGEDAERVADGYRQMGTLGAAYEEIRKSVESLDAAKPTIAGHHNFAIMTCLEWYENARTKHFVRQVASKPSNR